MDVNASGDACVRRLRRRLHDGLGQRLSLAVMQVDQAAAASDASVLLHTRSLLREALHELRAVIRSVGPAGEVAGPDLPACLLACTRDLASVLPILPTCTVDGLTFAVSSEVCDTLIGATRELLVNACKHGAVRGVDARLVMHADRLSITVTESHAGDSPALWGGPPSPGLGLGLQGVRHDLSRIGARLRWRSRGTQGVQARICWAPQ